MNSVAYRTTGLFVKTISALSKVRLNIHEQENIPHGSIIFVINHFTRIETLLLPYHLNRITGIPVWSLADDSLFKGALGKFLDAVGAVSTRNPHRDQLIVKTLLTGEALWVIFPEGRMVKSKKIFDKGRFMIFYAGGKRPPHTGAATLALRTEFYRQRLKEMVKVNSKEANRIKDLLEIRDLEPVLRNKTFIVPINMTYFPLRGKENILSNLAEQFVEKVPERIREEIMTEGTMLLSGVDIDMRIGQPIQIENYLGLSTVGRDIKNRKEINFDDPIPSRRDMRKAALEIMQRYMSAIYNMTTVNHDHLFASILRMIPRRHIDVYELKQRAFLAASADLGKLGVHYHSQLKGEQLHLLTDDRFNRFRDFLSLAVEKKVIKKSGKTIVKDPFRFSISFDFHKIRIENPVAVIANEVEPLKQLQRHLRRVSWMPRFWLRRKIAQRLLEQAISEYHRDYRTYYIDGESKNKAVGMPYLIKGKSRKIGVLLIHGYMAAPLEVKELAEHLGRQGIWVYVPRLKGHGTSADDLAARSHMDWVRSVDIGYAVVRSLCERVVTGGFSTGAGLALHLATRVDDLAGVFAVCPPMRLHDFSVKFVPAVDVWNRLMQRVQLNGAKKEFVENHPENPHINYFRNPISGVRELERLMTTLEPKLPSLKIPVLIVQSAGDPVVDPKGSKRIFELLGSENKQYTLFHFNRHGILLGKGAEVVHRVIGNFIKGLS
ncbi:MAG: alpha/beta fold hydrolase [Deltaproteobacteria bacterium]|nr:alpha/beta fold hydrolase [Deltaproteobacteria bacterium]